MSDLLKQHFRATNGLDAGGNKVINVALADRNVKTDGVSVEYVIQENTIQKYDPTRGYLTDFAVTYGRRIWIANKDIPKPAGAFNQANWTSLRVDPNWIYTVRKGEFEIQSGQFINVDSNAAGNATLLLPLAPDEGDTIVVRDIGGRPGYNGILIKAQDTGASIVFGESRLREVRLTRPYSQIMFTFSNGAWRASLTDFGDTAKMVVPNGIVPTQVQAGDNVVRRYTSNSEIFITLPLFANSNDIINFTDLDGTSPINHMTVRTFDPTISIGTPGQTEVQVRTSGNGFLVYDSIDKIWRIFENDLRTRVRIITSDVTLMPNEHISVFGADNNTVKTINVTLPTDVAVGDTVTIAMNYMRKGQTVVIKASDGDTIASNLNLLQFPKRSEYPPDAAWVQSSSITFNGTTSYVPVLGLAYIEDKASGKSYWIVTESDPTVERVDAKDNTTRARLGVIALATQAQANAESSPEKELAITPETLNGRRSTETQTGIARIATSSEVNQSTTASYLDNVIVTPKKLNERAATETRRGLAEIATNAKMDAGEDDFTIVTPKKLLYRTTSDSRLGVIQLVKTGGAPNTAADRSSAGTGIFDHSDYKNAVTPKTLREYKATVNQSGIVWLASDSEVRNGTPAPANIPTVVTPESLHKKVATDGAIGLIQIATQTEVNAGGVTNKAVTPKTLNDRTATNDRTGIARFATPGAQGEFEAGTSSIVMVNPKLLFDKFANTDRIQVNTDSGLTITGNLWDHYTINIQEASTSQRGTTTLATAAEVRTGTDAKKIVTAATLHAKTATEGAIGLAQYATQAQVDAGTLSDRIVPPAYLKQTIQVTESWQATDSVRGTVRLSTGDGTWKGNDTNGSTLPDDGYASKGVAVSPYELNLTLKHYLPRLGKAYDTGMLGGQTPDKYARRDIAQTISGAWTFSQDTAFNNSISVQNILYANGGEVKISPTADTGIVHVSFQNKDGSERGIIYAEPQTASAGNLKVRVKNGTGTTAASQTYVFGGNGTLDVPNEVSTKTLRSSGNAIVGGTVMVKDVQMLAVEGLNSIFGAQSQSAFIRSRDADTQIFAQDSTGSYPILTTKNYARLADGRYVNKAGDTMTGNLNINSSAIVITGSESWYVPTNETVIRQGSWTAEIKDATKLQGLRGYMVPIRTPIDPGNPSTLVVTGYEEKTAAGGVLTQVGVTTNNTYQLWTPYPPTTETADKRFAHTVWMRIYNPNLNKFDDWMRVFTSATPPTAADIGAPSSVSTQVKTLEVLEWIKLGPVKIWPDRPNQTLKFEWVGD